MVRLPLSFKVAGIIYPISLPVNSPLQSNTFKAPFVKIDMEDTLRSIFNSCEVAFVEERCRTICP